AVSDLVEHGAFFVQLEAPLVHVIKFCELARFHRAFGRWELPEDGPEQRGFAEAVPPADTDAMAVLECVTESAEQFRSTGFHAEISQFHRAIAELRRRWNAKFNVFLDHRPGLRGSFVV